MSNYLEKLEVSISIIFIHIRAHLFFYLLNTKHFLIKQLWAL